MTARAFRLIVGLVCLLPALVQGGEVVTRYEHDGAGNRTAMIRPGGERWEYRYDAANRLEAVTSPEGAVTTYDYNRADHRIKETDAEGRITLTPVDALGRPTSRTYANGDVETFDSYDANNNLTLRHDGNGQAIESSFDAFNRPTRRTYSGPADPTDIVEETWAYSAEEDWVVGTQRAQDGTLYTSRRNYDRQSRLDDEIDRYGEVTNHIYDARDYRVGRIDPEGQTVFQPDRLNRLRSVQPEGEGAIAIDYTAAGHVKSQTYPNGATVSHDYDVAGRVATITHRQHNVVTAKFTYVYDLNGNRKSEIHVSPLGTRITTYVYDRDERLTETQVTDETGVVTDTVYTLDKVGNRKTERVHRGGVLFRDISYTYNARHQLTDEHDSFSDRTTTRLYDGNGFMTSETTDGVTTSHRPNLQDRLATLTTPSGPPVHYAYDLDGRRVEKRTTAVATRYAYDGADLRRETNVANNLLATYDWAGGRVLRTRASNQTSYAQHDALKSPTRWSRADGGEQARASYSAWGELSDYTGVLPPIGYTGYYADAESQLLYAQQRYYQPRVARFNRADPWTGDALMPITLHKYLYANGNPLRFLDPSGLCGGGMGDMVECAELYAAATGDTSQIEIEHRAKELSADFTTGVAEVGVEGAIATGQQALLAQRARLGDPEALRALWDQVSRLADKSLHLSRTHQQAVAAYSDDISRIYELEAQGDYRGAARQSGRVVAPFIYASLSLLRAPKLLDDGTPSRPVVVTEDPGLPQRIVTGETESTKVGRETHAAIARERRESGMFDVVNEPIRDESGSPILVPRRVDLRTGEPATDTPFQTANPDAASYGHSLLLDDKPMGRPLAKDRQEIIRNLEAYRQRVGSYPEKVVIQRYDPKTGKPVVSEIYAPEDFLPRTR